MTVGIDEPLEFLAQGGTDWEIQVEVLHQARQMQIEARGKEIETISIAIGNSVAKVIGQMFR
jgi:hypothetical protein